MVNLFQIAILLQTISTIILLMLVVHYLAVLNHKMTD